MDNMSACGPEASRLDSWLVQCHLWPVYCIIWRKENRPWLYVKMLENLETHLGNKVGKIMEGRTDKSQYINLENQDGRLFWPGHRHTSGAELVGARISGWSNVPRKTAGRSKNKDSAVSRRVDGGWFLSRRKPEVTIWASASLVCCVSEACGVTMCLPGAAGHCWWCVTHYGGETANLFTPKTHTLTHPPTRRPRESFLFWIPALIPHRSLGG